MLAYDGNYNQAPLHLEAKTNEDDLRSQLNYLTAIQTELEVFPFENSGLKDKVDSLQKEISAI